MNDKNDKIDFFALGECLIDLISTDIAGSIFQANRFDAFVGGQPANLAMNMAKLGHSSALACCLGSDGLGEKAVHLLETSGVTTDFLQFSQSHPTTIALITRKKTGTPEFILFRGADSNLQPNAHLAKSIESAAIIHFSAFSLSRNPARDTILQITRAAKQRGQFISFDPNYHPEIWPDHEDFRETICSVLPLVDIIKPSLDDSSRLFGSGLAPASYAQRFLDLGVKTVVLTMGHSGVFVANRQQGSFVILPNDIEPADLTGAGDAFWAGLLSGMLDKQNIRDAARLGQAAAEHKIQSFGPVGHFPSRANMISRAQQIQYQAINERFDKKIKEVIETSNTKKPTHNPIV